MNSPTKRAVLKGLAELANITIWVFALLMQENAIKSVLTHYSLCGDFTGKKNAH